ncbi:hypothetical protein Tco_0676331 [Tanacetum coccineum]
MGVRQANQFNRVAKVEFPKFYGEDVLGWIFKCDLFFLIDSTPEEEKVKIISVHLFDKALLWHRQLIKSKGENVTWIEYKEAITLRFGSVFDDPIAALKNANLYLGGLPTELEMAVRMFKPKTLSDAYCLTTLQEATLEAVKKKSKFFRNQTIRRFGDTSGNGSSYKESSLYSLVLLPDPGEEEDEEFLDNNETLGDSLNEEVHAHISLNALSGVSSFQTMRYLFLAIFVPGGKHMVTMDECKDFQWQLYGHTFTADVMLLPLGGSDMQIEKIDTVGCAELMMMSIYPNTGLQLMSMEERTIVSFSDHSIPLMPGTQPVNIKPYRNPPVQKDAIEAMVKELLKSGVIKHSQSSFAYPVVMVKKKDNSWRMCVDYR